MKYQSKFLAGLGLFLTSSFSCFSQLNCADNLLTNSNGYYGGFESGRTSISATTAGSDLYNGLPRNGSYQVVQNISQLGGGGYLAIRPRTGKFFLAAHTSNTETDRVWYANVNVQAGMTYNFCTYVTLLKNLGSGANYIVGLYINGQEITTGRVNFNWTALCGTYTVPQGVTNIELSIRDPKKGLFFLAMDDICFAPLSKPADRAIPSYITEENNIHVYPNPSTKYVNINIASKVNCTTDLSIIDQLGKTVLIKRIALSKGTNLVNLSSELHLIPGLYFIQTMIDGKQIKSRFLVGN